MNLADQMSGELVNFITVLRLNGYRVSTEQCIAVHKLLVTLASQGNWPEHPHKLGSLIAPILCTSREEQETFHHLYEQWLGSQQSFPATQAKVAQKTQPPLKWKQGKPKSRVPSLPSRWRIGFIWLGIAVIALALAVLPFTSTSRNVRGRVLDEKGRPVANESVAIKLSPGGSELNVTTTDNNGEFYLTYNSYFIYYLLNWIPGVYVSRTGYDLVFKQMSNHGEFIEVRLLPSVPAPDLPPPAALPWPILILTAAAILLLLIFAWLRNSNRKMELKKWRAKGRLRLNQLVIKEAAKHLVSIFPLRRTAQELRRHREYGSYDLNVQRTIEKTISRGLFTLTYAPRKSPPEYLVLIDRAGFSDQRASLVNRIIEWLISYDVLIERYYFQADPRICRKDDPKAPRQTLQDLAARYSESYMLVFSDAEGFFDPLTGRPQHWLQVFSSWDTRVLLTPEFNIEDYRQRILNMLGFKVLPADQTGLAALSEVIYADMSPSRVAGRLTKAPPALLWGKTGRWLEDHPPAPEILEALCGQLKSLLGSQGYYWFSACAVYPLLSWDLTLHLGYKLISQVHFTEKFSTLMRLPWFQHGSIPDWLRIRLIEELSPAQEAAIREELLKLLLTPQPNGSVLNIVSKSDGSERGLLERFWRKLSGLDLEENRILLDSIKAEPAGSVMRDYVLMDFMSGRNVNRLALIVPQELRQLLSPLKQPHRQLSTTQSEPTGTAIENIFAKAPPELLNALTLDRLTPGTRARVIAVSGGSAYARRLMEMGFTPGAPVHVVRAAPLGDPLEIRVRDYHVALRRSEMRIILVVIINE